MFCCLPPNGNTCTGVETKPRWRSATSTKRTRASTPCVSPPSLDTRPTQLTSLSEVWLCLRFRFQINTVSCESNATEPLNVSEWVDLNGISVMSTLLSSSFLVSICQAVSRKCSETDLCCLQRQSDLWGLCFQTSSNRTSQRIDVLVTVGVVSTEKCWVIQAQSGGFQTAELWNEFVSEGRWREQPALASPLL